MSGPMKQEWSTGGHLAKVGLLDLLHERHSQKNKRFFFFLIAAYLVSHYSAIGDAISCDAPYCAIGFRGKLFCDTPLVRSVFGLQKAIFYGKKWGCGSDSLRYHRKHSAKGDMGG